MKHFVLSALAVVLLSVSTLAIPSACGQEVADSSAQLARVAEFRHEAIIKRDRTAGEFVLRLARFKKIGDRKLLTRVLKNEDLRWMANVLITERLAEEGFNTAEETAQGEGFFARLITWFSDPENQAKIEAIIKWLQELFAGFDV